MLHSRVVTRSARSRAGSPARRRTRSRRCTATGSSPAGMDVLRGREWDAVVDTSGFVPKVVGRGAALLADSVGHYVFVSSVNAYPTFGDEPIRADSPVHDCAPDAGPQDGKFDLEQYGPYKVGSERAVDQHFAGRSAHLRAGLIIGPYDDTGRFPYWVGRMARGGEVLAPGRPDDRDPAGRLPRPGRLGGGSGPQQDHRRVRGDRAGGPDHVRRDARRRGAERGHRPDHHLGRRRVAGRAGRAAVVGAAAVAAAVRGAHPWDQDTTSPSRPACAPGRSPTPPGTRWRGCGPSSPTARSTR